MDFMKSYIFLQDLPFHFSVSIMFILHYGMFRRFRKQKSYQQRVNLFMRGREGCQGSLNHTQVVGNRFHIVMTFVFCAALSLC